MGCPTAELVGKVGRLWQHRSTDGRGCYLTVKPAKGGTRCCLAALTPKGDVLALATDTGAVYALHLDRNRFVQLDDAGSGATAAAFMARATRRLFVAFADRSLACYDIMSSSQVSRLPAGRTAIQSLSVRASAEQLSAASVDGVSLWQQPLPGGGSSSAAGGLRRWRMLSDVPYGTIQASFTPDEASLVALSSAGEFTVWSAKSLQRRGSFTAPAKQVPAAQPTCFAISPDSRLLLAGCRGPLLLLYDLAAATLVHALQLPMAAQGVVQVHFLPDSRSAAVLGGEGCIRFMDVVSGQATGELPFTAPGGRAQSFCVDDRGNTMAVVCADGAARLFELALVRRQQRHQRQQQQQELRRFSQEDLLLHARQAGTAPAAAAAGLGASQNVLSDVGNTSQRHRSSRAAEAAAGVRKQAATGPSSRSKGSTGLHTRALEGPAALLSARKLQDMLAAYGEYPRQYRLLIWDHLLQLPHNSAAFAAIEDLGTHGAFADMERQYSMQSPSLLRRLKRTLSHLAHWCPLFGEVGDLPGLVFPFVKLFGANAEGCFELLATLLLNWTNGWFEMFPNPPVSLLRRLLLLLAHHDPELASSLKAHGAAFSHCAWSLLSCLFSDALTADSWLVVWDHCFTAGPGFHYHVLCSLLVHHRQALLAASGEAELVRFFANRQPLDIPQVIRKAYELKASTPAHMALAPAQLTPLPKSGPYPQFTEFPIGSVEVQRLERQRIGAAEDALIRRRQLVAELEQRTKQVAFQAGGLAAERQQLAQLEQQRRAAARAADDQLAAEGAKLDDRAKEEKLRQVRLVEEAYQASLQQLRADWQSELHSLKAEVEHRRRLVAHKIKARQEDEDIKALEFQAQQRLWALEQDMVKAAGTSDVQDQVALRQAAMEAEQRRKAMEWDAEDEARRLMRTHEAARHARMVAQAEQAAAQQAATGLMLANEIEAQEKLIKVEHDRQLRRLAEEQAEVTAKAVELERERDGVKALAEEQAIRNQAQEERDRYTALQRRRLDAIEAERAELQRRQAELATAAKDAARTERMAVAERKLEDLKEQLLAANAAEEAEARRVLAALRAERQRDAEVQEALRRARLGQGTAGGPAVVRTTRPAAAAAAAAATAVGAGAGWDSAMEAHPGRPAAAMGHTASTGAAAAAMTAARLSAQIEHMSGAYAARREVLESQYGEELDEELRKMLAYMRVAGGGGDAAAGVGGPSNVGVSGLPGGSGGSSAAGGISGSSSSLDLSTSAELAAILASAEGAIGALASVPEEAHFASTQSAALRSPVRSSSPAGLAGRRTGSSHRTGSSSTSSPGASSLLSANSGTVSTSPSDRQPPGPSSNAQRLSPGQPSYSSTGRAGSSGNAGSLASPLSSLGPIARSPDQGVGDGGGGSAAGGGTFGSAARPARLASSSATSEELEVLLRDLSAYEARLQDVTLMGEIGLSSPQGLSAGDHRDAAEGGEAAGNVTPGSSVSWSQTLRNLGLS